MVTMDCDCNLGRFTLYGPCIHIWINRRRAKFAFKTEVLIGEFSVQEVLNSFFGFLLLCWQSGFAGIMSLPKPNFRY